ncbi:hypothetical protein, partial [Marinobacter xestospongiae]|uniref:hypothetical protein n=1 Tax=Marinobacter xestospongiae TaxID=994319 RepID=UPI0031D86139
SGENIPGHYQRVVLHLLFDFSVNHIRTLAHQTVYQEERSHKARAQQEYCLGPAPAEYQNCANQDTN